MTKPSVITLFAVFAVLAINSDVTGADKQKVCKHINEECISDQDCCENVCRRSYNFKKYCRALPLMTSLMTSLSVIPPAIELRCVFKKSVDSPAVEEMRSREIGLNAAADHDVLKPGTRVKVTIDHHVKELRINDQYPNTTDVLELSEIAAKLLGMTNYDESKPCKVEVPFWVNHTIMRRFLMIIPVSGIVYVLYFFNQYNLY